MKTILSFAAILLVLTSAFTCGKEKEEDSGNVPYTPCQCNDKPLASLSFPSGEAFLFKDSVPNDMVYQIRNRIVFNSKTGAACLR